MSLVPFTRIPNACQRRDAKAISPMQTNQDKASARRGPKRRGAIYCSCEHRREDQSENRVKSSFLGKEPLVAKPHHGQRNDKNNDPTDGNLKKRQSFWLVAQSQRQIDPF